MTYYAEANGQHIIEDIYEGGILRYEKDSQPYCDLWRFETKKERDEFVSESDDHNSITLAEAKKKHKNQFRHWKHNV